MPTGTLAPAGIEVCGADRAALLVRFALGARGLPVVSAKSMPCALQPLFVSYESVPLMEPLGLSAARVEAGAVVRGFQIFRNGRRLWSFALPHLARGYSRAWLGRLAEDIDRFPAPRFQPAVTARWSSVPVPGSSEARSGREFYECWGEGEGELGDTIRGTILDGAVGAVFPTSAATWGGCFAGRSRDLVEGATETWERLAGRQTWRSPSQPAIDPQQPLRAAAADGTLLLGAAACSWPLPGLRGSAEIEIALAAGYLMEPRNAGISSRLTANWEEAWRRLGPRLRRGRALMLGAASAPRVTLAVACGRLGAAWVERRLAATRGAILAEFVRGIRGEGVGLE